jgi:protein-disulfide isomerase
MNKETKVILGIGLIVIAIGVILFATSKPTSEPVATDLQSVLKDNDHQTGSKDVKVTIVEFGDYQCPACAFAHGPIKQITETYKGGSKLNFIFKNYPLPSHRNAFPSAQAAEAAALQGKFWEMHNLVYERQEQWSDSTDPVSIFKEYAKELGLDLAKFEADYKSDAVRSRINADAEDGKKLGIDRTPTIYINGVMQEKIPTYDDMKKIIDSAQ